MKKIVILTGSEFRHDYVRKFIALDPEIEVIASFCEGVGKSYGAFIETQTDTEMRTKHLLAREQSEKDFFKSFVESTPDKSNPLSLQKGDINKSEYHEKIVSLKPDLIVAFGCSLIKEPLISAFSGKFLNVHLGLSPYYRGSATNYWPLVNGEPEFVGATFMYIDAGIDTGEIIHQIRASIICGDTPSSIGNRLIKDMALAYREIIKHIDRLPRMPQPGKILGKVYRQKDYDERSVQDLYTLFSNGLVETYIRERDARWAKAPIVSNSGTL